MPDARPRSAAIRKIPKKGTSVGSGGQRRRQLEGRGPTPPAEAREHHPAAKRAAAPSRATAAGRGGTTAAGRGDTNAAGRGGTNAAGRGGAGGRQGGTRSGQRKPPGRVPGRRGNRDAVELVTGRNAVGEALAAGIAASTLYIAERIDSDDRVRTILRTAADRSIPVLEAPRPELDRLTDGAVHQGVALAIAPYSYAAPADLLDMATATPLIVALDGVTDPHNLGAVIRSAAAFGAAGVVVPERRAAGVSAGAWKASAGAVARVRVARAGNLTRALLEYKRAGLSVVGLAGEGAVDLSELSSLGLAIGPLVVVVGAEGKGLSRLVRETCDATVSIAVTGLVESLNASVAAGIVLHAVAAARREATA